MTASCGSDTLIYAGTCAILLIYHYTDVNKGPAAILDDQHNVT